MRPFKRIVSYEDILRILWTEMPHFAGMVDIPPAVRKVNLNAHETHNQPFHPNLSALDLSKLKAERERAQLEELRKREQQKMYQQAQAAAMAQQQQQQQMQAQAQVQQRSIQVPVRLVQILVFDAKKY